MILRSGFKLRQHYNHGKKVQSLFSHHPKTCLSNHSKTKLCTNLLLCLSKPRLSKKSRPSLGLAKACVLSSKQTSGSSCCLCAKQTSLKTTETKKLINNPLTTSSFYHDTPCGYWTTVSAISIAITLEWKVRRSLYSWESKVKDHETKCPGRICMQKTEGCLDSRPSILIRTW